MKLKLLLSAILSLPKSIYLNLQSLPFSSAIKLPILIHYNTKLNDLSGIVKFEGTPRFCCVKFGFTGSYSLGMGGYWSNSGMITFNQKASFARGTQLICGKYGQIVFGHNFESNANCIFNAGTSISFGDNCLLSWNISLLDGDGHKIIMNNEYDESPKDSSIIIGDHVWICMNSVILKGAHIGDNSVIASNSTVNKKINMSNVLIAGVNKVTKSNINWIK